MGENSWYWGPFYGKRRKYYGIYLIILGTAALGLWVMAGSKWPDYPPALIIMGYILGPIVMCSYRRKYGRWW